MAQLAEPKAKCAAFNFDPTVEQTVAAHVSNDSPTNGGGRRLGCTRDAGHTGDHVCGIFAWRAEGGVPFKHEGKALLL